MRRREAFFVLFGCVLLAGVASSGCKPKAGGGCKIETKEVCIDEKKALACHDAKWEEMTCKGPDGCSKATGEHVCDQSVAEDKDVCNLADDYVCTGDKKGMLQCTKNKWTLVQSCLGDRSCVMEKKKVTCDNSVANVNDACREEEDYACTPDKKAALACRQSKFVQASLCKGPKGCRVAGSKEAGFKVECDDSVAQVGDACEKEEHFSCANDEKSILKCKNKKFDVEEKCKPKEKCQIKGGSVGCW
jgi:hypothetical protein